MGGATESFAWDVTGAYPLLLTDAGHAYVYGVAGVPLEQVALDGGAVDYLHADTIGSVVATTDGSGAVTSRSDYDLYGVAAAVGSGPATSSVTRFGYAGEYTDPTGYLYLRARYFDPATAQFLSVDPLVDTTGNPYGYTSGNPLQMVDPLGLWFWDDWEAPDVDWAEVGLWAAAGAAAALGVACVASVICGVAVTGGAAVTTLVVSGATVVAVGVTGAAAAGTIDLAVQQQSSTGWMESRSSFDGDGWQTPRNNGRQNDQARDAIREAERQLGRKLTRDEQQRVHWAIHGQGYGYWQIVEEVVSMFGCSG